MQNLKVDSCCTSLFVMNMPQRNAAVAGACVTHKLVSTVNEAVIPHRTVVKAN